jgi:diaminobutyrate-2-oxoglutarate transaminase
MKVFQTIESEVRYYCRQYPAVFATARNARLTDEEGNDYIDFLAGAGALNYGHNNPRLRDAVIDYLRADGITHSLDLHTRAKLEFLQRFQELILAPRGLRYKVQFTGPTGTNSVEAALKLARLATRRRPIVAFTNGFHGMSLGALAATGNKTKRQGAGTVLPDVLRLPFEGYGNGRFDGLDYLETALADPGSGIEPPAGVIVETVQAEGGLNVASTAWLQRLARFCRGHGCLLIVDDIQAGCGRTGRFFSFEDAEIVPDLVCLSKSIGGLGLPLALLLLKPEWDCWEPGQHNGTFRGHNLAFVAGTEALEYWRTGEFERELRGKAERLHQRLAEIARGVPGLDPAVRGRGLIQGLRLLEPEYSPAIIRAAFERRLILEACGSRDQVLKIMPPLTIETELLDEGLDRLKAALDDVLVPASAERAA